MTEQEALAAFVADPEKVKARVAEIVAWVERHASNIDRGKGFQIQCSTCRERFMLFLLADREAKLAEKDAAIDELCEKYRKSARDAEALERHFATLEGTTEAVKAVQLLCRAGRKDWERADAAEDTCLQLQERLTQAGATLARVQKLRNALAAKPWSYPRKETIVAMLDRALLGEEPPTNG